MAFLDKVSKMMDIANKAVDIGAKIKANDLLSGINLGNVNPTNIGSIQSQIEGTINSKVSELTSQIEGSINVGDIESIANSISLSDFEIPQIPGLEGITFQ